MRISDWSSDVCSSDLMITCAKGLTSGYLPLGACLISDRLLEMVRARARPDLLFNNGYTYSGHPVCCAAALKSIEIIEQEGILEHVREISPHFLGRLAALEARSEEHTSELQSLMRISYAVFCLNKKNQNQT